MIREKYHMSLSQFGLIWGLFITFHFGLIFNDLDYFQFWTEFRSFGLISKKQSEFEKQYKFRKKVVQMEEQMKTLNEGTSKLLNLNDFSPKTRCDWKLPIGILNSSSRTLV